MQAELKILLQSGYLSRKQYRELLANHPGNLDDLGRQLLQQKIVDPPDWTEALTLISNQDSQIQDKAPDSRNLQMQAIHDTALRVAQSDTTILLLGESGVGKSRLAHLIHTNSARKNQPFVTVSCGSIPDTLLESELFGVVKGAYTGAHKTREGRFERAHKGTIFLDEIGELGPALQVKLLRVIQDQMIEPLGSSEEIQVDVRLITATNRNLEEDIKTGRFRKDLYFRLNVIPITLPSLSDRKEDILELVDYFLKQFESKTGQRFKIADDGLRELLLQYEWPGNIRELENCVERLTVLCDSNGNLHARDLPPRMLPESFTKKDQNKSQAINELSKADSGKLKDAEKKLIKKALQQSGGNLNEAAQILGIHRNTLRNKIKQHNLNAADYKKSKGSPK